MFKVTCVTLFDAVECVFWNKLSLFGRHVMVASPPDGRSGVYQVSGMGDKGDQVA